jgi:hypothetical protein
MAIGQCKFCRQRVRVGTYHECPALVGGVDEDGTPAIVGPRPQLANRNEGTWPTDAGGLTPYSKVATGNELLPQQTPSLLPSGNGVCIFEKTWHECEPRILTIGNPPGGAMAGQLFPPITTYGETPGGLPGGIVDMGGVAMDALPYYLAAVLEYGSGSVSQKAWFDWAQGSYNVPACEWMRMSALPWGDWGATPLNTFSAKASAVPGQLQGAMVPTLNAVGNFTSGVARAFYPPMNARAVEVNCIDATTNVTIQVSGGASGSRNYSTGVISPGWTPLLVITGDPVLILTDANAALRLTWFLQL